MPAWRNFYRRKIAKTNFGPAIWRTFARAEPFPDGPFQIRITTDYYDPDIQNGDVMNGENSGCDCCVGVRNSDDRITLIDRAHTQISEPA